MHTHVCVYIYIYIYIYVTYIHYLYIYIYILYIYIYTEREREKDISNTVSGSMGCDGEGSLDPGCVHVPLRSVLMISIRKI